MAAKSRESIHLQWNDVTYTVKRPAEAAEGGPCKKKQMEDFTILDKISGVVEPGQMLAIMGPSGSGKTTLLNVLAGIIPAKKWTGSVLLNGSPVSRDALKVVSGYVPQEDILTGSQTVREALLFYATLRLPTLEKSELEERVDKVIEELGLTKVRDSLIGYVGADATNSGLRRGLSGGERKRLSIGQQLITNPSLLFLDEPTTGLDSFAAESVVSTLVRQVMSGRTVIFTIHQPSTENMSKFDRLMLLGHGKLMYFGPNDTALKYFKSIGYRCPPHENTGDYFLELLHKKPIESGKESAEADDEADESTNSYAKTKERAAELSDKFSKSTYAKATTSTSKKVEPLAIKDDGSRSAGFFTQLGQLLIRNFKNTVREPASFRVALIQSIAVSVIMGLVYLQLDNDQKSIQDRAGAIFFAAIFQMFGALLAPFALFPIERKQFIFQTREGLFTTHSYYVARFLTEVPKFFVSAIVFTAIFYWLVMLRATAQSFFIFVLIGFLLSCAAFSFATVIIGAFPDPAVALTVFPLFFIPMMIFSGFYANSDNTPVYFIWAEWVSFMKYSFRALMNNEMVGATFKCTDTELAQNRGVCPYTQGEQWLKFRKLDDMPIYGDALILVLFIVVLSGIGWILLHRLAVKSKK